MEKNELQEKVSAFATEYRELCEKHGVQLSAFPNHKLRDDGTYSLVIEFTITEIKK